MTGWGLQSGASIWIGGHDTDGKRLVHHLLIDMPKPPFGPIDAAFVTPESVDEAVHFTQKLSTRLGPGKRLWVLTPKNKPSQQATIWIDLDNRMFEMGFTKVVSVDVEPCYEALGYEHTTLAQHGGEATPI